MDNFQKNTVRSFRKVKEDMKNLQMQVTELLRKLEMHEGDSHMHMEECEPAKKKRAKPKRK
ncbi:MAG: hypothetical protein Q8N99_07515 [Nanoarchaeota archaeon]|nr:hypothetical protein [Nanoarchaeota archaeon]